MPGAAEPVPTRVADGPAAAPADGARIIPLTPRGRGRRAAHRNRSGGQTPAMSQPAQPADHGHHGDDDGILRPLAEMIELSFAEQHMSLSDPRTLAAFQVAIDVARTITAGAQAQGIVDEAQQAQLEGLLEGAKRAAALVADE